MVEQPRGQRRVSELVLGRHLETGELTTLRQPGRDRVEDRGGLLAPLALLGFVAAICTRNPRRLGSALPFLLTTVPLVRFGVQRRSPATFWAPFGSLVRALAFGAGIAQAFIALFTGKALRGRRAQIAAAAAGTAGDQAQPRKESREAL